MVISPRFHIPFIISEVISNKTESDRWRMLVEAIPLARAGQFLLKPTSKKTFFVVAIYVTADLVASRYIVMSTRDGNAKKKSNAEKKDNMKKEVDPVSIDSAIIPSYSWKCAGVYSSERFRSQKN